MASQIEVTNLTKFYQMGDVEVRALDGISLKIEAGEFVAIMGPSGSGKSTLMQILGLLDVPTNGSYKLNGQEVSQMSEDQLAILRRKSVGFIFQQFNLLSKMSAAENVALPLLYSEGKLTLDRARELLKQVGLANREKNRPNQMSGGQQQRVAIARSLINSPTIVFADEPTGNLDSQSEKEIVQILKDLNAQGITIIIVTHEEEVGRHAKRIIRFRDGKIQSDDVTEKSKPQAVAVQKDLPTASVTIYDVVEHTKQGFRSLAANKVRTVLSMLGILIGVAAVIAMLALGTGAQRAIEQQLASLGSNLLVIRPGTTRSGAVALDAGTVTRLTLEDAAALKQIVGVKNAVPTVQKRVQVVFQSKNWSTTAQGVGAAYASMRAAEPEIGRFFTEDENRKRSMVAVLGMTVVKELFGDQNPIGETIKINRVNFQVIGIVPPKGATGWRDQDDVIIIPVISAMKRLLGKDFVDAIELEAESAEQLDAVQEATMELMANRHRVPATQQNTAFEVRNMADVKEAMSQSSKTMSVLLAAIAAISLIVGGIGIMNIMLVTVTERTKEVGLRKAIGARRIDILLQFLVEAVVVSSCGGIIGIVLGWLATLVLSALAGWTTTVSLSSVLVSFFFSVSIGMIFGIYPAQKASRLHPIQALRHD